MTLYMAVTADEYELPVAVTDRAKDLAEAFGIHKDYFFQCISRGSVNKRSNVKFLRIEVES